MSLRAGGVAVNPPLNPALGAQSPNPGGPIARPVSGASSLAPVMASNNPSCFALVGNTIAAFFSGLWSFISTYLLCGLFSSSQQPQPQPMQPVPQPAQPVNPVQRINGPASHVLVGFYGGIAPNTEPERVYLEDIIHNWSNDLLESRHNYIQWLFPLRTQSGFNANAPVLNDQLIAIFRNDPAIRANVKLAFNRMLRFYGLQMNEANGEISRAHDFMERSRVWLTGGNHNFLRITRILESLRLMGLTELSNSFFASLQEIHQSHGDIIGDSFGYWQRAARS